MPDPIQILRAMAAGAALAAVLLLVVSWPWPSSHPPSPLRGEGTGVRWQRVATGWVLGVSAGFYLGAVMLGLGPRLSLAENRDRFLLLVLPGAIIVELIGALSVVPRWAAWAARAMVAAAAAPVLMWGSVYLKDLSGPGSRLWTTAEMSQWFGALAAALAVAWVLLGLLMHVAPTRSVPLALAVACAGSAVVIMFSGSAVNGQLGLPLAGSLAGAAIASAVLLVPPRGTAAIGVGVVGLFALLVGGVFFAELPLVPAAVLFAAPLLCWLPELHLVPRFRPWVHGGLRVLLVAIAVALALYLVQKKTAEESQAPAGPGEPSPEDYMNFGK